MTLKSFKTSCFQISIFIAVMIINSIGLVSAQQLAFPEAEGFGKYTSGGRGGKVLIVKNLNDHGPGSLREAIRVKEPRIIVFAVSGTIPLESSLDVNYGNLTIAGQSAPGDGICLKNYPLKIKGENVIVRYLRARMGDEKEVQDDAISIIGQKNIIIDHCSFSWATDEVASFYDNENFTLQYCIISESLNASVHEKGEHGYGGIWGGKGATFHHNLIAHHKSRNPRFNGARTHGQPDLEIVDFRNNVIYNWQSNSVYAGEEGNYNMVNNYYKPGPATDKSKKSRIIDPWKPYGKYFISGNFVHENEEVSQNNYLGVACENPDDVLVSKPIEVIDLPEENAVESFGNVLTRAGASYKRDVVDLRVINEVRSGTAQFGEKKNGIINSQKDVGSWPGLNSDKAQEDTDQDGMSDLWELENNLDPNDPQDHNGYNLDNNFTNIEVYLNDIIKI